MTLPFHWNYESYSTWPVRSACEVSSITTWAFINKSLYQMVLLSITVNVYVMFIIDYIVQSNYFDYYNIPILKTYLLIYYS